MKKILYVTIALGIQTVTQIQETKGKYWKDKK